MRRAVGVVTVARLIELMVSRLLPVTGMLGYEKAEVTAGGVELSGFCEGTEIAVDQFVNHVMR